MCASVPYESTNIQAEGSAKFDGRLKPPPLILFVAQHLSSLQIDKVHSILTLEYPGVSHIANVIDLLLSNFNSFVNGLELQIVKISSTLSCTNWLALYP